MALDGTNPSYAQFIDEWTMQCDCYDGEDAVKAQGTLYLPATDNMIQDGMTKSTDVGMQAYSAYKTRAVFPDYFKDGIESLTGMLHQKPPTIELPAEMKSLLESCSVNEESLELFLRRINVEQLITGRCGLLVDLPEVGDINTLPYLSLYDARSILNWDDGPNHKRLQMVVLNESQEVRNDNFDWTLQTRYRLLQYGNLLAYENAGAVYSQGLFVDSSEYDEGEMIVPVFRGRPLDSIPFVFVNAKDLVSMPDHGPLAGLARLCLAIYRGEADYRQNLFMQGQDTLVIVGGTGRGDNEALRTGAGVRIEVDNGGDAKYIGVNSKGLPEQRQCLTADRQRAELMAGKLISENSSFKASGEALRTRFSAQTATLNQLALAGAGGLQQALRKIARWMGADPAKVRVTPNLEFADFGLNAQELVYLMTARSLGAPMSLETVHRIMEDKGMTILQFGEELAKYEKEMSVERQQKLDQQKQQAELKAAANPNQGAPASGASGSSAA